MCCLYHQPVTHCGEIATPRFNIRVWWQAQRRYLIVNVLRHLLQFMERHCCDKRNHLLDASLRVSA